MRRIIFLGTAIFAMAANLVAQDCTELFISEYLEGSGNNKGVEIYNPTDGIINLGSYYIARYSNGHPSSFTDGGITQLEGFIQSYSTHLIVNGQTTTTETSPASDPALRAMAQQLDHDYPAPTYMNGNDAIALFKDTGGGGDVNDFVLVDLFGIIGGGMTREDIGWASITDQWIYKNIYESDSIIGKDSAFVTNYIIPEGYYFLNWWLWSKDHSLVRKPGVKHGVTAETMPLTAFDVTVEWDTVPGGKDIWDYLNAHSCDCDPGSSIGDLDADQLLKIYPNPTTGRTVVSCEYGMDRIRLFDLTGKMVRNVEGLDGINKKVLHLDGLTPGIYMVRIRTGERSFSKKLMVR
ncbi:MAG: T9SS type A sorting domain-containing protein [Bacteroidota bacterium]